MEAVTLSNTDQNLIVVLIVLLSIFFLLCIFALIWFIQILISIKKLVKKAELLAKETEATVSSFFKKTSTGLSVVGVISNIAEAVMGNKKHHGRGKGDDD